MGFMLTPKDDRWTKVCEIARAHGAKDKAIAKWRDRGFIPSSWHAVLLADERAKEIPLSAMDFAVRPTHGGEGAKGRDRAA